MTDSGDERRATAQDVASTWVSTLLGDQPEWAWLLMDRGYAEERLLPYAMSEGTDEEVAAAALAQLVAEVRFTFGDASRWGVPQACRPLGPDRELVIFVELPGGEPTVTWEPELISGPALEMVFREGRWLVAGSHEPPD